MVRGGGGGEGREGGGWLRGREIIEHILKAALLEGKEIKTILQSMPCICTQYLEISMYDMFLVTVLHSRNNLG